MGAGGVLMMENIPASGRSLAGEAGVFHRHAGWHADPDECPDMGDEAKLRAGCQDGSHGPQAQQDCVAQWSGRDWAPWKV